MFKPEIFFINGYGAAPIDDENYKRYLTAVKEHIGEYTNELRTIYLAGGFTNRTDISEARAMERWFEAHGRPNLSIFRFIEMSVSARDNIRLLRSRAGNRPVVIFCEYTRRRTMSFFASRFFTEYIIVGIPFDKKSLTLKNRIKQLIFNLPLEVLAWYLPTFDSLRLSLRRRRINKARREELERIKT